MFYAVPVDRPDLRPVVFVTHNEEKALPTPFLRRCIFHYVEFPSNEEHLRRILSLHDITEKDLNQKAIEVLLRLRQMDLNKNPGLSELIDWVSYMQAVKTPIEDLDTLPYIGVLLKQQIDQHRAQKEFK
jgi:MoxR-like ATPase